jgi:hypothetical protein
MRHPTVILAVIMASIVLSCTDAEAGEDSGPADSLAESNSESVANSEPRWRRIGVEDDAVLGIDQLVKSDQGFRRWEWSLREDERLLRPNSPRHHTAETSTRFSQYWDECRVRPSGPVASGSNVSW